MSCANTGAKYWSKLKKAYKLPPHLYMIKRQVYYPVAIFLITALAIVGLHLSLHPVRVLGMDTSIFYMDEKYTLASFFTTITAFLGGFLYMMSINSKSQKLDHLTTLLIGVFLMLLSIDEFFEVHEYTNTLIKIQLQNTTPLGILSNISWIFPLSLIIIGCFTLFFLKILRENNKFIKRAILGGSYCFVIVLVFELLGSLTYGQDVYVYLVAMEEGLEMIGVTFFLMAALLEFHSKQNRQIAKTR